MLEPALDPDGLERDGAEARERPPRRPRLLFVVTSGGIGGAQRHIADVCEILKSEFDIRVACGPGDFLPRELRNLGVGFTVVPSLVRAIDPRRDWNAYRALRALAAEFSPDIVHAHTSKAGALVRMLYRKSPRPRVFYTPHNWSFNSDNRAGSRLMNLWLERLLASRADKIICVSEAERRLAIVNKVGSSKNLETIYPGRRLSAVHGALVPLKATRFRLVWLGRLEPPKDPDTAIEAFRGLPPGLRGKCELVVVGGGSRLENLRAGAASPAIRFTGECGGETALAWIKSGDLMVVSSHYESFGLAILESLGLGVPVIASDTGGIPEIIRDGIDGILVKPADPDALRAAMTRLLENEKLRAELARNGLARCALFSPQRMAEALRALYRENAAAFQGAARGEAA
jgi:glycosyltransferase involved in cell wall biosynthesis